MVLIINRTALLINIFLFIDDNHVVVVSTDYRFILSGPGSKSLKVYDLLGDDMHLSFTGAHTSNKHSLKNVSL